MTPSEPDPRRRWLAETYGPAAARAPEREKSFATPSGLPLEPLYGDGEGMPGDYPYTRGIRPTMFRGRLWTMRQYAGFASASETNRRFRYLLDHGQTGLSTAFDLPTQMGYDPDHPLAAAEVGKVGVAVPSLADFERLLEGIPLDRVSISMTINATAPLLLSMLAALAKKQGVPVAKLQGTVQNDLLKEFSSRGTFRFPVRPSLRLVVDTIAWANEHAPEFNPISISGYHMREAGCTAVQEIAFTLGNGVAYVEAALARGLDVDRFGARLSFFFNAHNHLFEEVAKFRAARRMWARIMRERFGAKRPEAWQLRFHTQTAGSMLTSQQPENNVVRVAMQALAAVLGGTQSLHTNSKDEALSLPSEGAARTALRTQQILALESGVADVIDPLGGAPMIEALTDELEGRAAALMKQVETMGGSVAAIESGFVQREIHRSALAWQRDVESGARKIVGVNVHQVEEPQAPNVFRVDARARDEVMRSVEAVRKKRDAKRVEDALARVEADARDEKVNLLPPIGAAIEAYATVGEICGRLEKVFGRHVSPAVV
ncbi:MAG TPA: methylmalonyl-CoA mutase family protein [Planctomycetota bacterium]|nr:methylmalonyl-CoA mutase family protein [Planctomycetota bacterium]